MSDFWFKHQYLMLFAMMFCCSDMVLAGEKVSQAVDADSEGTLYIENTRGHLHIQGWDKPQILVEGELDDAARKLIFKRKGRKAVVKVLMNEGRHHGHGSKLKIFVPVHTRLLFKGVNTHYSVSNVIAKLEGKTINGSMSLKDVHSKIMLSSVSGKVKVRDSSGVLLVDSVSAKVDLDGRYDLVKLKSMSGKVMVNIDEINVLKVENVSGDTAINGELQNNAQVRLNSVSGDIHYVANGRFNGECQIASQFGGKIMNYLTKDKPWKEQLQKRKLQFVSGDGSGKLMMNTISGTVTLEK